MNESAVMPLDKSNGFETGHCLCDFCLLRLILQAITSSGTKKHDLIFGEIHAQLKNKGVTTEVKVNSDSNVRFYC